MIDELSKEERIESKSEYQVYLHEIITRMDKCIIKYKRYLDNETLELLKDLNKLRNWSNHVPESLLMSEIKLIREGKFREQTINPIEIYYSNYCTIAYIEDLLSTSKAFYEVARNIHQRAKRDYSQIIKENVRIQRIYSDKPLHIDNFEPAKLSAQVQTIKGYLK